MSLGFTSIFIHLSQKFVEIVEDTFTPSDLAMFGLMFVALVALAVQAHAAIRENKTRR